MTTHVEEVHELQPEPTGYALVTPDPGKYVWWYIDVPTGATSLTVAQTQGGSGKTWYGIGKKPVPADDITFGDPAPDAGTYDGQLDHVGLGQYSLAVDNPTAGRWWFYMNGGPAAANTVTMSATLVGPSAFWTDFVGCIEV